MIRSKEPPARTAQSVGPTNPQPNPQPGGGRFGKGTPPRGAPPQWGLGNGRIGPSERACGFGRGTARVRRATRYRAVQRAS